jgi:hypothetical protein
MQQALLYYSYMSTNALRVWLYVYFLDGNNVGEQGTGGGCEVRGWVARKYEQLLALNSSASWEGLNSSASLQGLNSSASWEGVV